MNQPAEHPEHQLLVDFGLGKLRPDESAELEDHLDHCEQCNDTLLNLQDDTFTGLVRSLPDHEGPSVAEDDGSPTENDPDSIESTLAVDTEPVSLEASETDTTVRGTAAGEDESRHAATVLVQSGEPVDESELPAELRDHPRYKVLERIGQGGMGQVYRAQHRLMNRPVALKLISSQLTKHPQAVERFRREVQAAAQLHHSNIVTAFDAEQAGDVHFLAMEFVDGTDLSDVVTKRGPLPVAEACEYIRQAAIGLQHAHEKGMVHRDIKPHNLMLVEGREAKAQQQEPDTISDDLSGSRLPTPGTQPSIKILDFGLAGFATEAVSLEFDEAHEPVDADTIAMQLTKMGSVMGTPDYIAPEQARDAHSADIRADIYSLGGTLHFLLTGKPPFEAASIVDKLTAHAEADRPVLSDTRDDVPPEVETVLQKMMAKDPSERYPTPADVASALEELIETIVDRKLRERTGEGSGGDGSGQTSYSPGGGRSRRRLALTAISTLFLAALAAVVFYIQTNNGVVRVEVTDPSLKVSIAGQTITMEDEEKSLTIRAGEQKLIVRQKDSNFELVTDSFHLRRGDDVTLHVQLLPGEVVVFKDGRQFSIGATARLDGTTVASSQSADRNQLESNDAGTSQGRRVSGHSGRINQIAFSRDGRQMASVSGSGILGNELILWDDTSGTLAGRFVDHTREVTCVTFSADGSFLFSGSHDGTVQWYEIDKLLRLKPFAIDDLTEDVVGLATTPDGVSLIAAYRHALVVWDIKSRSESGRIAVDRDPVSTLALVQDDRVLTGHESGAVALWDLNEKRKLTEFDRFPTRVVDIAVDSDGQTALVAGPANVVLHLELRSGTVLKRIPDLSGRSVAFSPDNQFAAIAGQSVIAVFDLASGETREVLPAETDDPEYRYSAVAFSPDGSEVVAGGGSAYRDGRFVHTGDFALRVWRLAESLAPERRSSTLQKSLAELATASRDGLGNAELSKWIETEAPTLVAMQPPLPRLALEWLGQLPAAEQQQLLNDGYLKWEISQLDADRQDDVERMLQLLMFQKQGLDPKSPDSSEAAPAQAVESLLGKCDTGFAVVDVPETDDAFISWYVLPRRPGLQSLGIPLVGNTARLLGRSVHKLVEIQKDRFRALRDQPVTRLPVTASSPEASADEIQVVYHKRGPNGVLTINGTEYADGKQAVLQVVALTGVNFSRPVVLDAGPTVDRNNPEDLALLETIRTAIASLGPNVRLSPELLSAKSSQHPLLKDALAVYTFEEDTFFRKDTKLWVRDVSGNGHDASVEGEDQIHTPNGKSGGALLCNNKVIGASREKLRLPTALLAGQDEYTMTLWIRDSANPAVPSVKSIGMLYAEGSSKSRIPVSVAFHGRQMAVTGLGKRAGKSQSATAVTDEDAIPKDEWFFLALTLVNKGDVHVLRVTINDNTTEHPFVAVPELEHGFGLLGGIDGMIDEVVFFDRALTEQEVELLRKRERPQEPPVQLSLERVLKGHSGLGMSTASLATTANGKTLISAGGKDKTARLWDTESGETLFVMPMENDGPVSVAITADGRLAAVRGTNGHIDLWDTAETRKVKSLDQTEVRGGAMAFSADGRRLVTGALPSGDYKPLSIVWDVETGERLHEHRFPFDEPVGAIAPVPGSDDVIFTAKSYWRWNTVSGELSPLTDWPESLGGDVDISSDGRQAAIVTNETVTLKPVRKRCSVQIRDLKTGRAVKTLDTAEFKLSQGPMPEMPVSIRFLAGDRHVAVGYMHGEIRVFEIETGRLAARRADILPGPKLVVLSNDRMASTGLSLEEPDYTIRIWQLPER